MIVNSHKFYLFHRTFAKFEMKQMTFLDKLIRHFSNYLIQRMLDFWDFGSQIEWDLESNNLIAKNLS